MPRQSTTNWWLKTTGTYFPRFWRPEVRTQARAGLFRLEALKEDPLHTSAQLLVAWPAILGSPCLVEASFQSASVSPPWGCSFSVSYKKIFQEIWGLP
jgi:hypothetical protein